MLGLRALLGGSLKKSLGNRLFSSLIIESPYESMEPYPNQSLPEFIWEKMDSWGDKTALVCGVTGRSYTYSEARRLSHNFGTSLAEAGFRPGQVLSIVLPNIPEFAIALLGALEAGMIVSTINPIYNAEEIAFQLKNSGSKVVITFPEKVDVVEAASQEAVMGGLPMIVVGRESGIPGARSFSEMTLKTSCLSLPALDPHSIAILPYSSGTTGLPKGVKLNHKNIVTNNIQINSPSVRLAQDTTSNFQEVIPCVLPFFHIYGLGVGMFSYMRQGCKLVTMPRFEPELFLKVLKEYKSTLVHVVPPLVQFLSSHPAVTRAHIDSVRAFVNGAASVSVTEAEKLMAKKKGLIIVSGYGLTETSPVVTAPRLNCENLSTVGDPVSDTQVKIVNLETGEIQDPTQPGEICCKGGQVMQGYHNNEEATREMIKDGWLHTGDVGYFDNEGLMYIVDRAKELIKVKGFQVAPLELEEILRTHPSIGDVGVVGKADPKSGEVPVAFVVLRPGSKQPTANEIKDFVASKVSDYKQLDSVVFVSAIPKNTTGKILRKELRESLAKG